MPHIGDSERATQNRVIRFFRERLGYAWLGDLRDSVNGNIMPERLRASLLGRGCSETLAAGAIAALEKAAADLQQGLYAANKAVYSLLKYGAKVREAPGEAEKTVYFIDFEDSGKNDFALAEEVTVAGNNPKRPDLVIYVNGIALAVIELKRAAVSVAGAKTKKIWLNLQLAKKPFACLDYILLHELAHLKVRDHGKDFVAILDAHMPSWREIKRELNAGALDCLPVGG